MREKLGRFCISVYRPLSTVPRGKNRSSTPCSLCNTLRFKYFTRSETSNISSKRTIFHRHFFARHIHCSSHNKVHVCCMLSVSTRVNTHKLLQVCKQVVANLLTSCQQATFALLVTNLF